MYSPGAHLSQLLAMPPLVMHGQDVIKQAGWAPMKAHVGSMPPGWPSGQSHQYTTTTSVHVAPIDMNFMIEGCLKRFIVVSFGPQVAIICDPQSIIWT